MKIHVQSYIMITYVSMYLVYCVLYIYFKLLRNN
jgi:hypothetical protein